MYLVCMTYVFWDYGIHVTWNYGHVMHDVVRGCHKAYIAVLDGRRVIYVLLYYSFIVMHDINFMAKANNRLQGKPQNPGT